MRRKFPDDRPEDVQPAPVVIPEQQPKAAESDDLEDGFREFPIRRKVKAAPVAMAAEINDPPKTKKVKRDEVDAEAKAVENAVQAGARTLEAVCRQTGAASGCTKCRNTVLSVLTGILKAKQNE